MKMLPNPDEIWPEERLPTTPPDTDEHAETLADFRARCVAASRVFGEVRS